MQLLIYTASKEMGKFDAVIEGQILHTGYVMEILPWFEHSDSRPSQE